MNKREFLGLAASAAVAAPVAMLAGGEREAAPEAKTESVYARVMRTGTIRCGYGMFAPMQYRDPNTGEFAGISYEITERVGALLGLKIDWCEETGWSDLTVEGLRSGRFDMFGSLFWPSAQRGRELDFSAPFFYSSVGIYVRKNDTRFDDDFSRINSPSVTVSVQDGEMGAVISASDYPKARTLSLPALADFSQMPMNVVTRKADVAFMDDFAATQFLKKNPGTLKNISRGQPIRVFENPYAFRRGEYEFARMINIAIAELHNNGEVERVLRKYDGHATGFRRIALPWRSA